MSTVKTLITTSSLPPGAGIGIYVHNLALWMSDKGHEVTVCRSSPLKNKPVHHPSYKTVDIPVPEAAGEEGSVIMKLYNYILEYSPDVIINNDNIYISNLVPYLPDHIMRINVVHGYRKSIFSWDSHRVIFKAGLFNHKYYDYIVAISSAMRDAIIKRCKCPGDKVKLIYNGVPEGNALKFKENRGRREVIAIVFAGGCKLAKGADIMVKAARILANSEKVNYKISWIGDLPDSGKCSKKTLENIPNVTVLGYLQHAELLEQLTETDILAMPSRAEGCPMLLLEAMSKGVISVVSDCPSAMQEIVTEAKSGFIVPVGSPKGFANVLQDLINSISEFKYMSFNAIDFFHKHLTIDACGGQIEKLICSEDNFREGSCKSFPPTYYKPYHRRPYLPGTRMSPMSVMERVRYVFGWLPRSRLFRLNEANESE